MKNIKIKYIPMIILILAMLSFLYSAEIEKYSVGDMKDVDLYILKGVDTAKQITIKGVELNLSVVGSEETKFEIFTLKQGSELDKFNNNIAKKLNKKLKRSINLNDTKNEFIEELKMMIDEFSEVAKEFKLVMSLEDPSNVENNIKEKFSNILIEKDKNGLTIDLGKVKNSFLLVPKNISLVIDITKGNANIQGTNGEIVINGQQLDANIIDVAAVINFMNKSGDISISNYEGVANLKTIQGDVTINNSSGKIKLQSSAGDVKINKFIGDINIDITVGDIQITNSEDMSINLQNKSGDVLLKNIIGKNIEINSASSDLKIVDTKAKNIKIKNLSGDIVLDKISSDINIDLNSGDVKIKDLVPNFKTNSKIGLNFGDISIEMLNPKIYQYYQSINETQIDFDGSIKLDKDLKICTDNKKCIVISLNYGQISVETKK